MGAVWGILNLNKKSNSAAIASSVEKMDMYYKANCVLDKTFVKIGNPMHSGFGAGLRYLYDSQSMEENSLYNNDAKLLFCADAIVDNREELNEELSCREFYDSSLILRAFKKWGRECAVHIRGSYAFAVYSELENKLYLFADQTSSRCLYYYFSPSGELYFSTLIAPIISVCGRPEINNEVLNGFLLAPGMLPYVTPRVTPYKNLYKLNAGSVVTFTYKEGEDTPYEDITSTAPYTENSFIKSNILIEEHFYRKPSDLKQCTSDPNDFSDLYKSCVSSAIAADGNIGVSLSSGLDSSSAAVLCEEILGHNQKRTIETFTYIPSIKPKVEKYKHKVYDETGSVKEILSMHPGLRGHFTDGDGKNCVDTMDECLNLMEIPVKAYVNIPSLMDICKKASENGCRVLITGQYGNSTVSNGLIDDILYYYHRKNKNIKFIKTLNNYCKTAKESRKEALFSTLKLFSFCDAYYKNEEANSEIFRSTFVNNSLPFPKTFYTDAKNNGMPLNKKVIMTDEMYGKTLFSLTGLSYLGELDTKLSLKYGVILRDPTRDVRMLDYCYSLEYGEFCKNGVPRSLIRNNFRGKLPDEILNDFLRYSYQNIDWHRRLMRDWNRVYKKISILLSNPVLDPYIDRAALEEYLTKNRVLSDKAEDETNLLLTQVQVVMFLVQSTY